jgi:formate dehydrogenase assembly factor FdhD
MPIARRAPSSDDLADAATRDVDVGHQHDTASATLITTKNPEIIRRRALALENAKLWVKSLENVQSAEIPPEDENRLTAAERQRLVDFLSARIQTHTPVAASTERVAPQRLNNRELANSVRDVLMIEDVGTHQPTANLVGDALKNGFDTHGEALWISQFQVEQYIEAFRKIVDATIFSTPRPPT